jgi:hypothetical protein
MGGICGVMGMAVSCGQPGCSAQRCQLAEESSPGDNACMANRVNDIAIESLSSLSQYNAIFPKQSSQSLIEEQLDHGSCYLPSHSSNNKITFLPHLFKISY